MTNKYITPKKTSGLCAHDPPQHLQALKRVWCLYRVSTLGQVDHDDIPMQYDQCHWFAAQRHDWEITNELYEKGVSGFKVSANDREALNTIREAAQAKKFDVLLVFMFDRIGRRIDETPFIMKWLVEQGIEVWSVREGQRRYDTHEDELLGFMYTWLSSGESKKIASRVSSSKASMSNRGYYTGGFVAYGYDAVRLGRVNKKDQPVRDLVINEEEAKIVEFIFRAVVDWGFGSHTIANTLNKQGLPTKRENGYWRATAVRAILSNPIYIGRMKVGNELSDCFDQYRIIDDHYFNKAGEIVAGRAPKRDEAKNGPARKINDNGILTGILFCGGCGSKMAFNHVVRRKTLATGIDACYERDVYRCYRKVDYVSACDSKSTYKAVDVNKIVLEFVRCFFERVKKTFKPEMIRTALSTHNGVLAVSVKQAERVLVKARKDMAALEDEAIKALTGEGSYTTDLINKLMPKQQETVRSAQEEFNRLSAQYTDETTRQSNTVYQIDQIHDWADAFDSAEPERKRMIISSLIDKITISGEYQVHVEFNLTAKQYLGDDLPVASGNEGDGHICTG